MDDLISRDYLREIVGRMPTAWEYGAAVSDIYDIIMKAPTVDSVPVVRCKDCKFGEPDSNGNGEDMILCQNTHNPIGFEYWLMPPEWFCADGERRDSE